MKKQEQPIYHKYQANLENKEVLDLLFLLDKLVESSNRLCRVSNQEAS